MTTRNDSRKLDIGMLLLGGALGKEGERLDRIWTVAKVNAASAKLVAHYGSMHAVATLNGTVLPPGWRVIDNRVLASVVRAQGEIEEAPDG